MRTEEVKVREVVDELLMIVLLLVIVFGSYETARLAIHYVVHLTEGGAP